MPPVVFEPTIVAGERPQGPAKTFHYALVIVALNCWSLLRLPVLETGIPAWTPWLEGRKLGSPLLGLVFKLKHEKSSQGCNGVFGQRCRCRRKQ